MSPEVWQDAKAVILATAADWSLTVEMPNESFVTPEPPREWVSIDIGGDATATIELGGRTWEESGAIWIHIMLPLNTGIDNGLQLRKAFSVAFRGTVPGVAGLYYRDHSFDPLGADDGVWRRLSLIVRYQFDDRLINGQLARAQLGGSGAVGIAAA